MSRCYQLISGAFRSCDGPTPDQSIQNYNQAALVLIPDLATFTHVEDYFCRRRRFSVGGTGSQKDLVVQKKLLNVIHKNQLILTWDIDMFTSFRMIFFFRASLFLIWCNTCYTLTFQLVFSTSKRDDLEWKCTSTVGTFITFLVNNARASKKRTRRRTEVPAQIECAVKSNYARCFQYPSLFQLTKRSIGKLLRCGKSFLDKSAVFLPNWQKSRALHEFLSATR